MTPTELNNTARRRYNAVNDTFWSDEEIYDLIYDGCIDLAREAEVIRRVYTASTVASTRTYAYPTNTMAIKRIEYNGQKLKPIDFREDDAITWGDSSTTDSGTPQYYAVWNETIYLRPIPDSVGTLSIYSINEPSSITVASVLEIPSEYHMDLVTYIVAEMAAKDTNVGVAKYYIDRWEKKKTDAKRFEKKKLRADSFTSVKAEESANGNYLGTI